MRKYIDLKEQRFGKIFVLYKTRRAEKTTNEFLWLCRCDCGTIKEIGSSALKRGFARSCGCAKTEKARARISEKNVMWKGDKVGYAGLHCWIRRRMPHKNICQNCLSTCNPDLANISQKYLRDLNDWEWLCRRCHMKKDGRLANLKHETKPKIICKRCERLRKHHARGFCGVCYSNLRIIKDGLTNPPPIRRSHAYKFE